MATYILNIETTAKNCSVSMSKNGELIALKEEKSEQYSHSEQLNVFIEDCMSQVGMKMQELSAIAVSQGPGSYTGLRIGVSSAKGLCYALDIPLISIDTMRSLLSSTTISSGIYIPMVDARRMEVFHAVFDENHNIIKDTCPLILEEDSLDEYTGNVYLLGDGAEKAKDIYRHKENVHFIDDIYPSAKGMVKLSYDKYQQKSFEDVAYFEPKYVKAFQTNKPKKTILEKLNQK